MSETTVETQEKALGPRLMLEVLVERLHTSSFEARESALTLRRFGVHGAFLKLLC